MEIGIILNTPLQIAEVKEENIIIADGAYKFYEKVKSKKILALVGDFDSIKKMPENLNTIKFEKEKNFSDGESAVRLAKKFNADKITIYGATGGRVDHVLFNINLLSLADSLQMEATIKERKYIIRLIKDSYISTNENIKLKGKTISILPFNNEVLVENSSGLYYPLKNLLLTKYDTRGLSNLVCQNNFSFNIKFGMALLIINL